MLNEASAYSFSKQLTECINYAVGWKIYDTAMNYKVIILPAILDAAINHSRPESVLIHFFFSQRPQNEVLGQLLKDSAFLAFVSDNCPGTPDSPFLLL